MASKLETQIQLAQRLLPTTGNSLILQVNDESTKYLITNLFICNTTSSSKTYSIYVNQGGQATGDQFALFKAVTIAANTTDTKNFALESAIVLSGSSASLVGVASAANAITITVYGIRLETL
jgi:hypothetical protein